MCFKYNYKNSEKAYSIYGYDALEMIDSLYSKLTEIAEFHNFQYPLESYDISVQTYIAIQRMKQGKLLQKEEYVCSKEAREITNEFLTLKMYVLLKCQILRFVVCSVWLTHYIL